MSEKERDAIPEILFVCVRNAGRSQMAAGFARRLGGETVRVRSAGSEPGEGVDAGAVEVMAEAGIDISGATPARLESEATRSADYIITMGCGDACPVVPGREYRDWALDDPAGQPLPVVRAIRDEIERRVRSLLAEIDRGT